jgi:hypothetical protein
VNATFECGSEQVRLELHRGKTRILRNRVEGSGDAAPVGQADDGRLQEAVQSEMLGLDIEIRAVRAVAASGLVVVRTEVLNEVRRPTAATLPSYCILVSPLTRMCCIHPPFETGSARYATHFLLPSP